MLRWIVGIILVVWVIGLIGHVAGGFINILVVVALAVFIYDLLTHHKSV